MMETWNPQEFKEKRLLIISLFLPHQQQTLIRPLPELAVSNRKMSFISSVNQMSNQLKEKKQQVNTGNIGLYNAVLSIHHKQLLWIGTCKETRLEHAVAVDVPQEEFTGHYDGFCKQASY